MDPYEQARAAARAAERLLMKRIVLGVVAFLILIVTLTGVLGSVFIIDQGERGVVLRNGAFVRVAEPGLGFKVPIIDSVVEMSVRTEKVVYEKVPSYSKDIQLADLQLAINFNLDASRVRTIYEQYGGLRAAVDRILTPRVFGQAKIVFGQFNARSAIEDRGRLRVEIEASLRDATKDSGIIITEVQLENIDFSKAFEQSIEERMKAEVEVQKLLQNWEREKVQADIVRTKANGEADAVRARAQAEADAIKLKGEAEATAIKARAHALQQNAALIELTKAERWNGALPTTMVPGAGVPLLQIGGKQ